MVMAPMHLPSSTFVGRSEDLERVVAALGRDSAALVTIAGRGGVGKTALAHQVVRTFDEATPVTWVSLAGVTDVEMVVPAIATAVGLHPEPGDDLVDALAGLLAHRSAVLVLDNAEHLRGAAPSVAALHQQSPGLRILVTSQAPLQLHAEQVVTLAPLPAPSDPATTPLEELAAEPAVALYCERASLVDARFELTGANASAVVELCRRLEGLPLAIELAAARAVTLPAPELVRRVDAGKALGLLRRPRSDAPERHHGLEQAIAWTYDLLAADERAALRRLASLVGTFDLDTAVELLRGDDHDSAEAAALDQLSALVDVHLVDPLRDIDPSRYSLPDSIRRFALARLDDLGEADGVTERRLRVRAVQGRRMAEFTEAGIERDVVRFEADHDDLLDAMRTATALGRAEDALDIARGLGDVWDLRGYGPVQEQLLDGAIELGRRSCPGSSSLTNAMLWSGYLGLRHGSSSPEEELVERLRIAEASALDHDDAAACFHAACIWVLVSPITGDFERAQLATEEGLRIADECNQPGWRAVMQVWAGMLAGLMGDLDAATQFGLDALDHARRNGDQETVVRAAVLLGAHPELAPEVLAAFPSTEEALRMSRELGLGLYEAVLVVRMVEGCLRVDDRDGAARWLAEAMRVCRLMAGSRVAGFALLAAASTAQRLGDSEQAAEFYGSIRADFDLLMMFVIEPARTRHYATVQSIRDSLGDEAFERHAAIGAGTDRAQMFEDGLRYAESLRPPVIDLSATDSRAPEPIHRLTERQLDVLRLLAAGRSNKDIAAELGVRIKTVMHHTTAIYRELGVRGRGEAAALAFRLGLID